MTSKLEIIGIDHGWSMMKGTNDVFVTGVKEITTTPAMYGPMSIPWTQKVELFYAA